MRFQEHYNRGECQKNWEVLGMTAEVRCEHCGKVAKIDPAGTMDVEIYVIGSTHKLKFVTPPGSSAIPIVVDNGGITDLLDDGPDDQLAGLFSSDVPQPLPNPPITSSDFPNPDLLANFETGQPPD